MKKYLLAVAIIGSLLGGAFGLQAQDDAAKKAEAKKKMLEKYDKNKDGKLDDDEKAAMKADQNKKKKKSN
jgi:Ni/Co efflux regulator RcnB